MGASMSTCHKCGAPLEPGAIVCSACGTQVAPPPPPPPAASLSPEAEYERRLALFVGDKYPFYAGKWAWMAEKGRPISWNWAAAALFVGWLGYRGLYRIAFIVIAIDAGEFAIESLFDAPSWVSSLFALALGIVIAVNGNRWYRNHVQARVADIVATTPPERLDEELVRQGRPSWPKGLGVFLIYAVALFVAVFVPEIAALLR